ncbi:MAG TPA: ion transporter [Lentisphaeria bacterium]|nr:MAG: ion transporter [Lentisphaerae bacterium GWF2_50_93]HCE44345.1 ion transporter [Lentisphaeria bacterium]
MEIKIPINIDQDNRFGAPDHGWRLRLYTIIFEADTRAGRIFDMLLISVIMLSVAVVMLDSLEAVRNQWGGLFNVLEWFFTVIFSIEYLLRMVCVRRPMRYATSVFGIIDLLAVAPTYLAMFFPGLHALIDVRVLRLLRIFRILKMGAYVAEFRYLGNALLASRRKIAVFMSFVMMVVIVMGTLMYVVEGPANGFTSVPMSIYWAITTVTTVGFGDITPHTDLGRLIASFMMLIGWGTLAVPTGIVSAEFVALRERQPPTARTCHKCLSEGHLSSACFCKDCGAALAACQKDKDSQQ